MNVLLLAFAIRPETGSEPGVGWNWARAMLERGWTVSVLTRFEHGEHLVSSAHFSHPRLSVYSVGSKRAEALALKIKPLTYIYQIYWQYCAFLEGKRLEKFHRFDFSHSITYAGIRIPSFMPYLRTPFIWGPIGGGEVAPLSLFRGARFRSIIQEFIRITSNTLVKTSPLRILAYHASARILVLTEETKSLIPKSFHHKTRVLPNIGTEVSECSVRIPPESGRVFLFAGRFLYWKGGNIALHAFARHLKNDPTSKLIMAGDGPESSRWRQLARRLGIDHQVQWLGWIAPERLASLMKSADGMLFPSLHDSGGTVVFEAAQRGLPVLCLSLGGPGLVGEKLGYAPVPVGRSIGHAAASLAAKMGAPDFSMPVFSPPRSGRVSLASWDDLLEEAYEGLTDQCAS
ncbi:MAG: glycosyltransferase [Sneathiella sp.]|nr:glycosyltransferase [Sneathiella sp.]